jgi:hypothetical protein
MAHRLILPGDLVWTPGLPYWFLARSIAGLFEPAVPPSKGRAAAIPAPESHRLPLPAPRAEDGTRDVAPPSGARRFLGGVWAIIVATLTFPLALLLEPFAYWGRLRRLRRLRHIALDKQLKLGRRLYAMRRGNPTLHHKVDRLNEHIRFREETLGSTGEWQAEKRAVLLRLAAPYVARRAVSGAAEEHSMARSAQAALLAYQEQKGLPRPWGRINWRRVGIGYAIAGCAATLIWLLA